MMEEKLTADEFYRLRDDRTNRCTDSRDYQNFHIRLIAEEDAVTTFSGQVQLLLTANMLSRWCRRVDFGFPNTPLVDRLMAKSWTTLHERIRDEVSNADPFGIFEFTDKPSSDVQYTLAIGKNNPTEKVNFAIDAEGWNVWASSSNVIPALFRKDLNPIGPAFAACIGVADAFKVATNQPQETRVKNLALSLLDFETDSLHKPAIEFPKTVFLGNIQLIGTGSVGSAAIYLLRMMPLDGHLTLIDHDSIKIENLNRSPLFGIKDVGQNKAIIAAGYMTGHISTDFFDGVYSQYIATNGRKPGDVDIIMPFANEYGVRHQLENNFPPIQVYGTTTKSWGINYHRHVPLVSDCSVCRFPELNAQVQFVCSTTEIPVANEESIDAAMPFLSIGAAVLAVADLIKLQFSEYPFTSDFAFIDFLDKMETTLKHPRRIKSGCVCSTRSRTIHAEYIASTKYFGLSVPEDKVN